MDKTQRAKIITLVVTELVILGIGLGIYTLRRGRLSKNCFVVYACLGENACLIS